MRTSSVLKFLIVVVLVFCGLFAQAQVRLVTQSTGHSCWAACIEMVTYGRKTQASFLGDSCRLLCQQLDDNALYMECNSVSTAAIEGVREHLGKNFIVLENGMAFAAMAGFRAKPAVLCHQYGGDETNNHMVVMSGTAIQSVGSQKTRWIRVYDPFPICTGSEYYISYEQYAFVDGNTVAWQAKRLSKTPVPASRDDQAYVRGVRTSSIRSNADSDTLVRSYLKNARSGPQAFRQLVGTTSVASEIVGQPARVLFIDSRFVLDNDFENELLTILQSEETKMYLIRNTSSYTALYTTRSDPDAGEATRWYLSRIERGDVYRQFFDLIKAPAAKKSFGIEQLLMDYLRKKEAPFLVLRFTDLDLEYIFREETGQIAVYDPHRGFTNIPGQNKAEKLSLPEFLKVLSGYKKATQELIKKP